MATRSTFFHNNPTVGSVTVEFDGRTGRERKAFPREREARRFYLRCSAEGKNPKIVGVVRS